MLFCCPEDYKQFAMAHQAWLGFSVRMGISLGNTTLQLNRVGRDLLLVRPVRTNFEIREMVCPLDYGHVDQLVDYIHWHVKNL